MKSMILLVCCASLLTISTTDLAAQSFSGVVVLNEPDIPTTDSATPSSAQMSAMLPGAKLVPAQRLSIELKNSDNRLLVLPNGSAFPEQDWPYIFGFLQRGGNLLVLGGRPFTRAAYRDHDVSGWRIRDYSVRFVRPLMIDQYQTTPGSEGLQFSPNPDLEPAIAAFSWKRGFSSVIRLSAVDLYKRGGSAGAIDARLDTLAWGIKDGRKLSAPVVQIDHLRNGFDDGRWIFLNAELTPDFYTDAHATEIVQALARRAMQGSSEFTVRPSLPLYLLGEPVELELTWHSAQSATKPLSLQITTFPEQDPSNRSVKTFNVTASDSLILPVPQTKGLHTIDAELLDGQTVVARYHSGFWIRDEAYLRSGPRLTVNPNYFELDGNPLAVVGTTYMSSETQRLYFEYPNVYIWDRDLAQIHGEGLNMIRTGWWTGWDKFCDENGRPYERTLRTIEAYLMTARKNGLPVQFNFFAFLPNVLGGVNPYLDPQAVRKQQTLISSVVARFHDVPWLAWDFINEPSISQHLWTMRPNGDPIELQKWNEWLGKRYPDRAALAAAWNVPVNSVSGTIPLPEEAEFTPRGMYVGHNSLKVYDFFIFAQEVFAGWVQTMRDAVRKTGSQQLVTVGQDEGGIQDRLSPAYWGEFVDFTTNHTWWQNDFILWDSILAKQPGKAMLIQETGLQRELNLDEVARRTPDNEAALLERKIAASFIQGAGAIEWLWNTNSDMTESNETPIGAIRTDGTEKPEGVFLSSFAGFAKALQPHLRNPELPSVAVITSQAAQYSAIADLQLEAQRKSVRALAYDDRITPYAVAENQLDHLGNPKLAILPSPQALTDAGWHSLLNYVNGGGALLVTGPVGRDEHWRVTSRMADLKIDATVEPVTYHNAEIRLGDHSIPLSFDFQKQTWLDALRFSDGSTFKEIPYGKGRVFWAAYPVELAEGSAATADLYQYVTARVGVAPMFTAQVPVPPGVLISPTLLED